MIKHITYNTNHVTVTITAFKMVDKQNDVYSWSVSQLDSRWTFAKKYI